MLISWAETARRTTLSRTTLRNLVRAGKFPEPVPLTDFRSAFADDEVEAWEQSRRKLRKEGAA